MLTLAFTGKLQKITHAAILVLTSPDQFFLHFTGFSLQTDNKQLLLTINLSINAQMPHILGPCSA